MKSKKALVFFIIFASFCFSAMTQMSFSMKDLSSEMMGVMMLVIGLVLAFTTLFLAITTVINGNTKTIAMMRVFGYSQKECCRAILGGYRPLSYIGFIIGTVYQYGLLRLMVDIVFKDVEGVPTYKFDFPTMLISLACFITIYEIMMYIYSEKLRRFLSRKLWLSNRGKYIQTIWIQCPVWWKNWTMILENTKFKSFICIVRSEKYRIIGTNKSKRVICPLFIFELNF